MKRIAIFAFLLLATAHSAAQECSRGDAIAAENLIENLNSWQSIYDAYKRYGHCDDGAIAEGLSDRIVHQLATQWDFLPQVQQLIVLDPSFQEFLLEHINASADTSELNRILLSASQHCPASAGLLCKQIEGAASER